MRGRERGRERERMNFGKEDRMKKGFPILEILRNGLI